MIEPLPNSDLVIATDANGGACVLTLEELLTYARPLFEREQDQKAAADREFHTRCAVSRTTLVNQ